MSMGNAHAVSQLDALSLFHWNQSTAEVQPDLQISVIQLKVVLHIGVSYVDLQISVIQPKVVVLCVCIATIPISYGSEWVRRPFVCGSLFIAVQGGLEGLLSLDHYL